MPDSNRFTSPDELRPTLTEAMPAAANQLAGAAVQFCIPALHRQYREAVTDDAPMDQVRLGERRCPSVSKRVIKRDFDSQSL
jgi:hypothetical protein